MTIIKIVIPLNTVINSNTLQMTSKRLMTLMIHSIKLICLMLNIKIKLTCMKTGQQ